MRSYYKLIGVDPFKILPLTFLCKQGIQDPEFKRFENYFQDLGVRMKEVQKLRDKAMNERTKILEEEFEKIKMKRSHKYSFQVKKRKESYYSDEASEEEEEDEEDEEFQKMVEQDLEIRDIKRKYLV